MVNGVRSNPTIAGSHCFDSLINRSRVLVSFAEQWPARQKLRGPKVRQSCGLLSRFQASRNHTSKNRSRFFDVVGDSRLSRRVSHNTIPPRDNIDMYFKLVERALHYMVHNVVDRLRMIIESRHRR